MKYNSHYIYNKIYFCIINLKFNKYPQDRPKFVDYINFCIADTNFGATDDAFPNIIGLDFATGVTKVCSWYTKVDIAEEFWSVLRGIIKVH